MMYALVGWDLCSKSVTMFIGERIWNNFDWGKEKGADSSKRSLAKAIAADLERAGSPLALAATFFQPHEALVHANFGPLFCKSINIERSRTGARPWPDNMNGYHSNKDPAFKAGSANGDEGLAVDEPLNHMCGRSVIFTNMRMIFVDAWAVRMVRASSSPSPALIGEVGADATKSRSPPGMGLAVSYE